MKKALRYLLYALAALVVTTLVALTLIVKLVLAPSPGEWEQQIKLGPISFDVGMPTVIRLFTVSWFAPQLDGLSLTTRFGDLRFAWEERSQHLAVQCAPCSAQLGGEPLRAASVKLTVKREVTALEGAIELTPAGSAAAPIQGHWEGQLSQKDLVLTGEVPDGRIDQWYALLVPALPELQRAHIEGMVDVRGRMSLPASSFVLQPRPDKFKVSGLGARELLNQRSACGAPSRLHNDSWIARAVVAAQDPDFFQHAGFEPAALAALLTEPPARDKAGQLKPVERTVSERVAALIAPTGATPLAQRMREWLYVADLEDSMDKPAILQAWLDNAPWGDSLCGVEPAARYYFKRSAARLEAAQAVWLATLQADPAGGVARWRSEGQPDPARTKAVSERIRGINYRQRDALIRSVAAAHYPPP